VLLKNKYLAEIAAAETRIRALRQKVSLIDELESDAEGISPATIDSLKYSNGKVGLTEAIRETVNAAGEKGIAASRVAKELKNNGFPAAGKNFVVTVGSILRRLAKRTEIRSDLRNGKRIYTPANADISEFQ